MKIDRSLTLYALPVLCLAVMIGPAGSIIQGIYTREFGLRLTDIAAFIVIARLFDAISDPAIGYISDRSLGLPGGRKFWVAVGAVVSVVAIYFLYLPPQDVSAIYFFVAFMFCYLGWTIVEIPHLAWGSELARSYDRRTEVFGYRIAFLFAGTMLFLALPLLTALYDVVFEGVQWSGISTEYTGETLRVAFWLLIVLFPITIFVSLKYCESPKPQRTVSGDGLYDALKAIRWNGPLAYFLAAMFLFFIGNGMQVAVAYLHLSSYLGLAEKAAVIYVVCFPLNILAIPVWLRIARRIEKHRAYALGVALSALGFVALGLMEPGETAFVQYMVIFGLLQIFQASWQALPAAILGDISDYGTLKSGVERSGTYFSLFTFMQKCFSGLGGAVGFGIAAWFGFDPALDTHNEESARGIKIVMGYIPALLGLAVAALMFYFPLTKHKHDIVRRAMDRRA